MASKGKQELEGTLYTDLKTLPLFIPHHKAADLLLRPGT